MNTLDTSSALRAYQDVGTECALSYSSPHQLIQMLYDGLIARLAAAKGYMQRGQFAEKGVSLGKALAILAALRGWLDKEKGGEIAENLDRLYDYMERRLMQGHRDNDVTALDEVAGLLREIKQGWDAIRPEGPGGDGINRSGGTGPSP